MNNLPYRWTRSTFSKICLKVTDGTHHSPKVQHKEPGVGRFKYITSKNVRPWGLDLSGHTYIDEAVHREIYSRCNPEHGDVLLTKDGANTGVVAINTLKEEFSLLSSVALLKVDNALIEPRFLKHYIVSPDGSKELLGGMAGTAIRRIILREINEASIPLPPLNEQKRIVAKIEELFSELEAGEESFRQARRQLGVYRQSLLKQAFEGKLTEKWRQQNSVTESASQLLKRILDQRLEKLSGKGVYKEPFPPNDDFDGRPPVTWKLVSMDALTCHITSGSRDWKKYYNNNGYAVFVMAQNVRPSRFDSTPVIRVSPPKGNRDKARSAVACDDLLVTIVGANTGDVCRVHKSFQDYYVCQSVALLRPVEPATAMYLELYMNSKEHGQKQFDKWMYGQGRPHLSFDQLRSTAIFLPPLPEQQEIVRLLDEQFTVIEQNERELDAALKRSEALRQSILKKAFSGQLVPQDPSDEPASVLLERIRAERKATMPSKKKTALRRATTR